MSARRKAIEELAEKHEHFAGAWPSDASIARELRDALAANPDPGPESEYEYWNGWVRRPRTAPGPWQLVTDDE